MSEYLADHRLLSEVAQQYRNQQPDTPTQGRAAIITAGVPGAGKSSALKAIAAGYRRIDPDAVKDILLARLEAAGLLADRLDHVLADGIPVSPGELAWWVHNASTDAADRVRSASLQIGENFVMEGTLSWHRLPDRHVDELAAGGYERLTVLDVEVPLSVAIEQSKDRWWTARQPLHTDHTRIGGRFISESTLAQYYSGPRTASVCAANARQLYTSASDAAIKSEILLVSRTTTGREYRALLTSEGAVQQWRLAPLGAGCIRCGAILTDRTSILDGTGPSCPHTKAPR